MACADYLIRPHPFGKRIGKKGAEVLLNLTVGLFHDKDEKNHIIIGDIEYRVFGDFRERHPKRFINMGICEQSIIGVSLGMGSWWRQNPNNE